jgi:FSR family fosmidomycin resistance protein-like MFS transporter
MRRPALLLLTLLAIEFLDEFVFGAREAAWPLIRTELGLSYGQIGLLLTIPNLVSGLVEPVIGILGDLGRRRWLILGGGLVFAVALLLAAISGSFFPLLFSFALLYPASGAFVTLSQATLMDSAPERREHNMARWTFAGSIGVVAGPIALGAALALDRGWRELFLLFAALSLALVAAAQRLPFGRPQASPREGENSLEQTGWLHFKAGLAEALTALRRREVLRWLALLEFSDLMLDVLLGFLALYFVDVVGATPAQAGLAVAVWTGVGLVGDLLLIPLLERVAGLRYLCWSAALELILFPAFLLAPHNWVKILLLGALGLFNAGWYAILQAQLYTAMPGRSGTVMAVGNLFGLVGRLLPLGLGLVAELFDLRTAMWLLVIAPVALLVGLPRGVRGSACTSRNRGT